MNRNFRLVFSPGYDIKFFGIEKQHPFDSCKYGRAWALLREQFGTALDAVTIEPNETIGNGDLLLAHTAAYLASLHSPATIAAALELPFAATIPPFLIAAHLLRPMRLAVAGTVLAAHAALEHGAAANLSGGYHHASREKGEGFCLFADVSVALARLRRDGLLAPGCRILYIDLDAHQGNGVSRDALNAPDLYLVDFFNRTIYPHDPVARARVDYPVALVPGTGDDTYLSHLATALTQIEAFIAAHGTFALAVYNAGTDPFAGDLLGGLAMTEDGIYRRDCLVMDALRRLAIPAVMLPSGGYSPQSYQMIARTVAYLLMR